MAQTGQTVALANLWLDTLRGVAWAGPVITLQLHDNHPGTGSSNVFAGATRQLASYDAPAAGSMPLGGGGVIWAITAGGIIKYVSAWTGLSGDGDAICLGTGQLLVPKTVANGDQFNIGTCPIVFPASMLAAA